MTLAQARAFVTVVDAGSFSEAGLMLGISQAAVSSSIRELERELGVRLLDRGRFGARMTTIGAAILDQARAMVQAERTARQIAAHAHGRVEGMVRIGVFHSVASYVLPTVLRKVARRFPAVRAELVDPLDDPGSSGDPMAALAASLRRRACDTAFLQLPLTSVDVSLEELMIWELFEDDYVATVSPAYRKSQGGRPFRMRDLLKQHIITSSGLPCGRLVLAHLRDTLGPPSNVQSISDDVAITQMVERGLGIGVLPRLSTGSADPSVELHPIEPRLTRTIAIATRADGLAAPAVRAWLAVLGELYPGAHLPAMPRVQETAPAGV